MKIRHMGAVLDAVVALAFVAMPGPSHAQQKVVIYSANDSTLNELVFAAFTKETGVQVEPISTGSGVLMKRIQAEKERPQGDIIWGVSRSLLETNKAFFAPYKSKNAGAIPAEYRDKDNLWTGTNLQVLVLLQNTQALAADQGPTTWDDLLDPKWKGKNRVHRSREFRIRLYECDASRRSLGRRG